MVQEFLQIAVFQFDLAWENPMANRTKIDQWLKKIDPDTDVVFLPEMFTTGFSMNVSSLGETMSGETIGWMKERCREYQLALCGSLIIRENDRYFNRLVFVEPSGEVHFYNKRHLFTMGNEATFFEKGAQRLIVLYKGWRICPLICYDLRFPVWSRNRNEYDLLVYLANWPSSRREVWNILLKARAIENQCYVAGINRIGRDGLAINYSGESQVFSPKGDILGQTRLSQEGIIGTILSFHELVDFRRKFPVLDDADDFDILDK